MLVLAKETFSFEGFSAPGYTQVPDEFFDVCLSHLSGAETKVICYLFRRTFGWKKDSDAISLSQITDGITRRDGTKLDSGAGVTRETATNALRGLEEKGLIVRTRQVRPDGGTGTTVYQIRFRGWSENPTPREENSDSPESDRRTGPSQKADSTPVGETAPQDPGPTRKSVQELTDTWDRVQSRLAGQFSPTNFATYVAPLELEELKSGRAILRAPSSFVGGWVRDRFATTVSAALSEELGRKIQIEIRCP